MATQALAPLTGHRADIQVLRGLAVLLVVLYHAEVVFPGGYIGVDVFFVISGFVIGRILIHEFSSTDRLSFRNFYARRFRRILPALALMLIVVVLLAPILAPLGAGSVTNATAAASALFSANFYLYASEIDGYFATASTLNPLLHTWSLAVEEQFYLAIPALLFVTWRATIRRTRLSPITTARLLIAAITVISLFACIGLSWRPDLLPLRGQSFAYFSPFTRAWEFCFGLGLVLLPARWAATRPATRIALGILGYGGITASALIFSEATNFPSYRAILPVAATALAILAAAPTPRLIRPLVFLGDNSYGWYLWHWPLIVFAAALWPRAGVTPLVIAAAVALIPAVLSRQLLERRLVPRLTESLGARSSIVMTVGCITLPFIAIALSHPIITRTNASTAVTLARDSTKNGYGSTSALCGAGVPLGPGTPEGCIANSEGATTIVLIGDSNAVQFNDTLLSLAEPLNARIELAGSIGCPMLDPGELFPAEETSCRTYQRGTLDELRARPRDIVIIGFSPSKTLPSRWFQTAPEGAEARLIANTSALINAVIATGARTVLINEVPKPAWSDPQWRPLNCSALVANIDIERCGFPSFDPRSNADFIQIRRIEDSIAAETGVETWDLDDSVCPRHRCTQFIDGTAMFHDDSHLNPEVIERIRERMLKLVQQPQSSPD